ncbi:MAG: hypothetical protein Q9170_005120 [Blastenia crenularia]
MDSFHGTADIRTAHAGDCNTSQCELSSYNYDELKTYDTELKLEFQQLLSLKDLLASRRVIALRSDVGSDASATFIARSFEGEIGQLEIKVENIINNILRTRIKCLVREIELLRQR